ncbi:MAG: PRC-barrel domain-containing protein [Cyanobacteria bacterium J06635_15]
MTDPADNAIRQSQLLNRLVIDYDTTEEVGHVDQVLVDVKAHQVEALVCKVTGLFNRDRSTFAWVQLHNIGRDSILVRGQGGAGSEKLAAAQPMMGLEVWTDAGNQVGRLVDYLIDPETGAVRAYLFASDRFRGITEGVLQLFPKDVISAGRKRIMVTETAADEAEHLTGGIATEATEFFKEDYAKTKEDWESALGSTKAIAEKFQSRAQKIAKQAKRQFSARTKDLQATTEELGSEVQKRLSDVKDQLQTGSSRPHRRPKESHGEDTIDITPLEAWIEDDTPTDDPPQSNT